VCSLRVALVSRSPEGGVGRATPSLRAEGTPPYSGWKYSGSNGLQKSAAGTISSRKTYFADISLARSYVLPSGLFDILIPHGGLKGNSTVASRDVKFRKADQGFLFHNSRIANAGETLRKVSGYMRAVP
jgi:hypothetical protein